MSDSEGEPEIMSESEQSYRSDGEDSDKELQAAFASGLLKTSGLNYAAPAPRRPPINNVTGLTASLKALKNDYAWIERMDVTTEREAPNAEGIENRKKDDKKEDDDDFARECSFYAQAQSALRAALPKLHKLKIVTKRPDDYFAQMAKSDAHMQKVRSRLLATQAGRQRQDTARALRDQKKNAVKVQRAVRVEQQEERHQLTVAVKKHKKGMRAQLEEMLGESNAQLAEHREKQDRNAYQTRQTGKKRNARNEKFGFGGRKKGMKRNTADSAGDTSSFSSKTGIKMNKQGRPMRGRPTGIVKQSKMGKKNKRPGKSARHSK